jgi:hypothetical protein
MGIAQFYNCNFFLHQAEASAFELQRKKNLTVNPSSVSVNTDNSHNITLP